jgi:electron transport complex protein RnfB
MTAIWIAIATVASICLLAGLGLSYASSRLPASDDELVESINELLPQTQCAQCGYAGCRPYARAIVHDDAAINLCPPGGAQTVRNLAQMLGKEVIPLAEQPASERAIAVIDEALCIGCTHCRTACPVDAIVGAHLMMHSIIESECTGCELCIAPCPVDCISLRPVA